MSEPKPFAMALKFGRDQAPSDWQQRLANMHGVSVTGTSEKRAQFTATPEAAEAVKSAFAESFHIEELVGRKP
jgi:hypothetical protein